MEQKKKILLVDDDRNFAKLYEIVFRSSPDYNFLVAYEGSEGLAYAKLEKPDLLLLDVMLPDLSGIELLKRLKQDQQTATLKVWMLTNVADDSLKEQALSLGAQDYILKAGTTPKVMLEKINSFFKSGAQTPPNTASNS